MTLKLHIYNPSSYRRRGYVATPWQPIQQQTGIPAERVAIFNGESRQLDTQVHEVDPADRSRDVLVFRLNNDIAPGFDDYSAASDVITVGERVRETQREELRCEMQTDEYHTSSYLSLANGVLEVKFELAAAPWEGRGSWYAGSASTVLLKDREMLSLIRDHREPKYREMLDAFNDEIDMGHDMEKRCMQIDQLDLSLPAWSSEPSLQVSLVDKSYELISRSAGPVRASACIASHPFEYPYIDPLSRKERTLTCRLYRVLSLYREADFVVEELSVRGTHEGYEGAGVLELHFTARYFMYMDFGYGIDLHTGIESPPLRHFRIPDWFALGCDDAPFQGYGFATSAHAGPVANPHPGFPDAKNKGKSFSFSLGRAQGATCVHLFARCDQESIEHRAGAAWYEHAFRPLMVKSPTNFAPAAVTPRNLI